MYKIQSFINNLNNHFKNDSHNQAQINLDIVL